MVNFWFRQPRSVTFTLSSSVQTKVNHWHISPTIHYWQRGTKFSEETCSGTCSKPTDINPVFKLACLMLEVWRNELRQQRIRRSNQRIRALTSRWLSKQLSSSNHNASRRLYKLASCNPKVTVCFRCVPYSQSVLGASTRVPLLC